MGRKKKPEHEKAITFGVSLRAEEIAELMHVAAARGSTPAFFGGRMLLRGLEDFRLDGKLEGPGESINGFNPPPYTQGEKAAQPYLLTEGKDQARARKGRKVRQDVADMQADAQEEMRKRKKGKK